MIIGMTLGQLLLGIATFALVVSLWAGAMLFWSVVRSSRRKKVQQRMGIIPAGEPSRELKLWHEGKEVTTLVPGKRHVSFMRKVTLLCEEAGWQIDASKLLSLLGGVSFLVFLLIWMVTHSAILAVFGPLTIGLGFWTYLQQRIFKRQSLFEKQFIDGLELAARSLRVGHPLIGAFRVIANEIPAPVGNIFFQICEQQTVGVGLDESLRDVADNSSNNDLKFFATAVAIQLRSGGNLADMMDRLAVVIRNRMRLNRRVRVLTAQTQFSKRVLVGLPILVFTALNIINPKYMSVLYSDNLGHWFLGIAAGILLIGMWMMNRLARLKY